MQADKEGENLSVTEREFNSESIGKKRFKNDIKKILIVLLFLALLVWQFSSMELFFKKTITDFDIGIIIKNIALFGVVNVILTGLFHRMKPGFMITYVCTLLIGIVNYFVISFRGYGIVFMDIYAIKTAATVAGSYKYGIDIYFFAGIVSCIAGIAVCAVMPRKKRKYLNLRDVCGSVVAILSSAVFIVWLNTSSAFFNNVSSLSWDHSIGISDYGYILYFVANAGEAGVQEPDGYSVQKVDEILSKYNEDSINYTSHTKSPNIIMIMNESFSDLSVLGNFRTNREVMPFFDSMDKNVVKGYVESSVYGGYTANSEFEFLTGCTKAFLPGNPYLQYMDDYLPSIISNIKEQNGYGKAIAMHPYNPSGYNRNRVYPLFYFDKFLSIDDFKNPVLVRDYISDKSDYEKIMEQYENKDKDSSLCLFNVTMQNHNPYDDTSYKFKKKVEVTNFETSPQVSQYLSLIKMSDDAFKELVNYFKKVKEPTIILLFGDHQPHLPDSFYQDVFGKTPLQFDQSDSMKEHLVPFVIWANYDIGEKYIERTSINYLSSILLEKAGLKMSNYNRYLLDLYNDIPSISATGFYDKNGDLHKISEATGEYAEKIKEYEMIQYNYLFDKKNRLDKYYNASGKSR